jgi:hypothetical protein
MGHVTLPARCKSTLVRSSNYRAQCSDPVAMPDGTTPWRNQIHHILCEHAITDISPEDDDASGTKFKFIRDCLCIIKWDINDSSNLIGLPLKSAYITPRATVPEDLPCHNVDHNTSTGYTYECKKWLHDNVWNSLVDRRKSHEVNAQNILDQLEACKTKFKGLITTRGARNGGTASSYKNRKTEANWYHPFSMAKKPTPRSPGGSPMPRILKMIQ